MYLVSFMHNSRGQVVIDRRFNTSQLVSLYLDKAVPEDNITWNPDNPNQLRMALPGQPCIALHVCLCMSVPCLSVSKPVCLGVCVLGAPIRHTNVGKQLSDTHQAACCAILR